MSVSQTSNQSILWTRACAVGVIKTVDVRALPWEPCSQSGKSGTFLENISDGIIMCWFTWRSESYSCPDTENCSCLPGAECWGQRRSVTCTYCSPEMIWIADHLRPHLCSCEEKGRAGLIVPETKKDFWCDWEKDQNEKNAIIWITTTVKAYIFEPFCTMYYSNTYLLIYSLQFYSSPPHNNTTR